SALFFISNMTSHTTLGAGGLGGKVSRDALLSLVKLPNLQELDLSLNKFVDNDLAGKVIEHPSLRELCVTFKRVLLRSRGFCYVQEGSVMFKRVLLRSRGFCYVQEGSVTFKRVY